MKKTFENCYDIINNELEKRRYKWNLKARLDFDYDDVKQIILIHVHEKWHLYNQDKPLVNWLNTIISHQIINLLRNKYYSHVKPCARCSAALEYNGCSLFGEQCSQCPLYAQWEKAKKYKYNTRLPVTIENHLNEIYNTPNDGIDIEHLANDFHKKMALILKGNELIVYKALFMENKTEAEVGKLLGLSGKEKNRKGVRYKRIQQIKKSLIMKAKKILMTDGYND